MVHIRIDRSAWDRRLSPNPHALVIYFEFVHARGTVLERFVFIIKLGFSVTTIIIGYEAQSTPFPWNIKPNT